MILNKRCRGSSCPNILLAVVSPSRKPAVYPRERRETGGGTRPTGRRIRRPAEKGMKMNRNKVPCAINTRSLPPARGHRRSLRGTQKPTARSVEPGGHRIACPSDVTHALERLDASQGSETYR